MNSDTKGNISRNLMINSNYKTNLDSADYGLPDTSRKYVFVDKSKLKNENFFAHENELGSGNWVSFTPNMGNPAYSHLDYAGTIRTQAGEAKTFTRGSFVPMLRLFMSNAHYIPPKPNDVLSKERVMNSQIDRIYPNPVINKAIIDFSIPHSGNIDISLFDEFGNKVRTIFNGFKGEGTNSVTFNSDGINTGVYYLKLSFDGEIAVEKIVVVK